MGYFDFGLIFFSNDWIFFSFLFCVITVFRNHRFKGNIALNIIIIITDFSPRVLV